MTVTQLFLVRVWRTESSPAGFCASVRRIDSEQAQVFANAADMARYLEQAAYSFDDKCDTAQTETRAENT